ncbi:MAG TPA: CYCXC family (seleno)protein [Pyrinomonadaceae bacterium]|jgi:hypothetical protein
MRREMKIKLVGVAVFAAAVLALACGGSGGDAARSTPTPSPSVMHSEAHGQGAHGAAGANEAAPAAPAAAEPVPAFIRTAAGLKGLAPTLAPEQFPGKARMAYQAVGEIPQTIAQLPCYCHCDVGFGHKSLHSCFEDDHAAHCAVCVDEALLAYKLQKQDGLKPDKIRELIVAQYSRAQ